MTNYTFSVVATNSIGSGEAGISMITTPPSKNVTITMHITKTSYVSLLFLEYYSNALHKNYSLHISILISIIPSFLFLKRNRPTYFQIINLPYHIAEIYYESFKFANFANRKTLAKIKASIYFWINIVQTKCIANN